LAHDPQAWTGLTFSLKAHKFYFGLTQALVADPDFRLSQGRLRSPESSRELGLGGKLLWAGELDDSGRPLVVAGNIAGAATLAATADVNAQKQAIREAIVDFLVTSLDEALRILKNEIRKRQTVAVCVGSAPDLIEREMLERGVQPDLYREGVIAASEPPSERNKPGENKLGGFNPVGDQALVIWRVDAAPAVGLPKLDGIALDCLDSEDESARRWIRLVPRYMGRLGHGVHLLVSNRKFAASFVERVRELERRGEIAFQGQIHVSHTGGNQEYSFPPRPLDPGD
jgi:hypothetical protein